MMVQLNEAYRVLRDPFLRQRYDEELKKFRSYGAKTTGEDEVSREEFTDFTLWINEQLKRKKSEKSKKMVHEGTIFPRPWIRFFAKIIDWMIWGIIFGFISIGVFLILFPGNAFNYISNFRVLLSFLGAVIWIPVEAYFISTHETTFGKWILNIRVITTDGAKLPYTMALKRSTFALFEGAAGGVPLLNIVFMFRSYGYLNRNKIAPWDARLGTIVVHKKIGVVRGMVAFALFVGLLYVIYFM